MVHQMYASKHEVYERDVFFQVSELSLLHNKEYIIWPPFKIGSLLPL